jgi:hypothetical protein
VTGSIYLAILENLFGVNPPRQSPLGYAAFDEIIDTSMIISIISSGIADIYCLSRFRILSYVHAIYFVYVTSIIIPPALLS